MNDTERFDYYTERLVERHQQVRAILDTEDRNDAVHDIAILLAKRDVDLTECMIAISSAIIK